MTRYSDRSLPGWLAMAAATLLALLAPFDAPAQFIDFETLPDGTVTEDQQEITTEYASFGVTFTLLSRETGLPIGGPRIAKAGAPQTAFEGCFAPDTPLPHIDLGLSFLTDGTQIGVEGDLLIEYAAPVAQASGIILDIDCRDDGGPPCEQWTIVARDLADAPLDSVVLDAPTGSTNPECISPDSGPGDADAFGWIIATDGELIKSILIRYTGAATNVGLAFDSFSVAGAPGPPVVSALSPADSVCSGETLELEVIVQGGLPPFGFQWEREIAAGTWVDLGTDPSQSVYLLQSTRFRVTATDALEHAVTSAPVTVTVAEDHPLCGTSLLVSNYGSDRVVQYSFLSHQARVIVPSGSGGLNGPSELRCRDDGHLLVVSQLNDSVRRYRGADGGFVDVFVESDSGGLDIPIGLDFGPDGNLYVASYGGQAVLRYDGDDGSFLDTFIPLGSGLNGPSDLVFGPDGNLYVGSFLGDKVLRFDGETGALIDEFVAAHSGGLDAPRGLEFGADGHLYIAEQYNDSVRRYDGTTGEFVDVFVPAGAGGLDRANDAVFGPDGVLYVASFDGGEVLRFDSDSGDFLGSLPDELLQNPGWLEVGCVPMATPVPDARLLVASLAVEPAVPNPFNPRTTVAFTLEWAGATRVQIVDLSGRVVATLVDRELGRGRHTVRWDGRYDDGRASPSGVYLVRVVSGPSQASAKIVLLR